MTKKKKNRRPNIRNEKRNVTTESTGIKNVVNSILNQDYVNAISNFVPII